MISGPASRECQASIAPFSYYVPSSFVVAVLLLFVAIEPLPAFRIEEAIESCVEQAIERAIEGRMERAIERVLTRSRSDRGEGVARQRRAKKKPPGVVTKQLDQHAGSRVVDYYLKANDDEDYYLAATHLRRSVLKALITELRERGVTDGRKADVEIKTILFLDLVANNHSYRTLRRFYGLTKSSISKYIAEVSRKLCGMYHDYVVLPNANTPLLQKMRDNSKFWLWFSGCLGTLDGSHVRIKVKGRNPSNYRNRKGGVSQNVLAVCDFDLNFVYVLPGFEGSANDIVVLNKAISISFKVPEGRYYLADGGYALRNRWYVILYQRTRYHLKEFCGSKVKPRTKEELFNLRHSQFRNCVERIFGVCKMRWPIL